MVIIFYLLQAKYAIRLLYGVFRVSVVFAYVVWAL